MKVSLLLINFQSAELTASAIASGRRASHHELEIVLVDNSCDSAEAESLMAIESDVLILPESNLGYAGGINRGLDSCTGEFVVVSNPDVVFGPASVDLLIESLVDESVVLCGPAFFWDRDLSWNLPPAETMRFAEQLKRNLALRFGVIERWVSKTRLERRLELWEASEPLDVETLSGAVMAFRTADLQRLRLDERYPLYFEEVDLMRRIRREGGLIRYVPSSRVQHLWAQSATRNPKTQSLFEQSRRRFQRRWYGTLGDGILSWTAGRSPRECMVPRLEGRSVSVDGNGRYLVELGDGREFLMAAGKFVEGGTVDLPHEVMARSPLETFCCRVLDLSTRTVVASWTVPARTDSGMD